MNHKVYVISERWNAVVSFRVQFVLTDDEYEQLKKWANDDGVSISKYVKDRVLPKEDSFKCVWDEFEEKLGSFPAGVEFNVATVMTQARWDTLDRSEKLSLARLFNKKVATSELPKIELVGRSSSNVSIYRKLL